MHARLTTLQRLKTRPRLLAGVAAGVLLAALAIAAVANHGSSAPRSTLQTTVVEDRPFAVTLTVAGTIAPGETADVAAPFEGQVKSVWFAYGDRVTAGQPLAELDTGELAQRRAEAEATYLKASQSNAEMASWASGPDASRARRSVDAARQELDDTRRKLQETKALLDRGLVARGEYDSLVQQEHGEELSLAGAQTDLAATLRQGQGANRRASALELDAARSQLAALDAGMAGAIVRAPAAGVIVRPPPEKAGGETEGTGLRPGQQMSKGQLIGSIARPGGLAVTFHLSETDANQVRPGMPVTVTGPGFGELKLTGRVTSVAGEASPANANSGPLASFAATARLDPLPAEQAAVVRIGMTANVAIDLYRTDHALVAPPPAIEGAAPSATIRVRRGGAGPVVSVPVRLGHTAPDGVEILSGVKPGDQLVWTPQAQDNAPASPSS